MPFQRDTSSLRSRPCGRPAPGASPSSVALTSTDTETNAAPSHAAGAPAGSSAASAGRRRASISPTQSEVAQPRVKLLTTLYRSSSDAPPQTAAEMSAPLDAPASGGRGIAAPRAAPAGPAGAGGAPRMPMADSVLTTPT